MSYLLFLDESGHDRVHSPHEVLAGVCIEDGDLWNFICQISEIETSIFGRRLYDGNEEFKGSKLLKPQVFKYASMAEKYDLDQRRLLVTNMLDRQGNATKEELSAFNQGRLDFVREIFNCCERFKVKVFASIVENDSPRPECDGLRKDYGYLFERYYYFLESQKYYAGVGLVVFDELEKTQSHLLIGQMAKYFKESAIGKQKAEKIVPEPFFVHSHLTTMTQVADVIAYIISWGLTVNAKKMKNQDKKRPELREFADRVFSLKFSCKKKLPYGSGEIENINSLVLISDLRTPAAEKGGHNGKLATRKQKKAMR